jgi:hypothetical protein
MTDQPTEGGLEKANEELPVPKFENSSAASATSSVDTKALAKEVAELLRPDFEKVAQSTKDKRIAEIEKKLKLSDLAELEGMGAQIPDNVKLEYRFRELESNRTPQGSGQAATSQGSGASLTAQDVSETVQRFKLDANQPDVIEKLRGTYRNRDHFEATLAQMALAQATKQPGSATSASTLISPPAPTMDEQTALQQEFDARAKSLRGIEIMNLKMEYRKKGLNIS